MPQKEVDHKHHRQRLKERFLQEGLDHFDPVNILELMLFYAIPQGDTNPIAHRLLDTFGSLSGVMNASVENLCQVKGVGQHAATLIKLFAAVVRPYLDDGNRGGVVLQSTEEICQYLLPKFAGRTVETFFLVCLDGRRRVTYCGVLSEGTLDSVPVFVRQIVEKILAVHAGYVILAHNHPWGLPCPPGPISTPPGRWSGHWGRCRCRCWITSSSRVRTVFRCAIRASSADETPLRRQGLCDIVTLEHLFWSFAAAVPVRPGRNC